MVSFVNWLYHLSACLYVYLTHSFLSRSNCQPWTKRGDKQNNQINTNFEIHVCSQIGIARNIWWTFVDTSPLAPSSHLDFPFPFQSVWRAYKKEQIVKWNESRKSERVSVSMQQVTTHLPTHAYTLTLTHSQLHLISVDKEVTRLSSEIIIQINFILIEKL